MRVQLPPMKIDFSCGDKEQLTRLSVTVCIPKDSPLTITKWDARPWPQTARDLLLYAAGMMDGMLKEPGSKWSKLARKQKWSVRKQRKARAQNASL